MIDKKTTFSTTVVYAIIEKVIALPAFFWFSTPILIQTEKASEVKFSPFLH